MSEETQKPKKRLDAKESDEKNSGGDRSPTTTDRDLSNNQAPTNERQTDPEDNTEEKRRPSVTESPATLDRGAEDSEKPIAPEDQPEEKADNGSNT